MKPYYQHNGITIYHGDWRAIEPPAADLVLADPPYGDSHDTDYTRFTGGQLRRDGSEVYATITPQLPRMIRISTPLRSLASATHKSFGAVIATQIACRAALCSFGTNAHQPALKA